MVPELKCCPYCHGMAAATVYVHVTFITCQSCGAEMWAYSLETAAAKWNARAGESVNPARLQRQLQLLAQDLKKLVGTTDGVLHAARLAVLEKDLNFTIKEYCNETRK